MRFYVVDGDMKLRVKRQGKTVRTIVVKSEMIIEKRSSGSEGEDPVGFRGIFPGKGAARAKLQGRNFQELQEAGVAGMGGNEERRNQTAHEDMVLFL